VGAGFGVDAFLGQPQALDGLAANQMLLHNLRGVGRLHMAVPHRIGIDDDRRPVFALVEAAGFVNAHRGPRPAALESCCNWVNSSLFPSVVQDGRARRRDGCCGRQRHGVQMKASGVPPGPDGRNRLGAAGRCGLLQSNGLGPALSSAEGASFHKRTARTPKSHQFHSTIAQRRPVPSAKIEA